MIGGAKTHYDDIKAFSETDLTEDLKSIDVLTLVIQGDDDQKSFSTLEQGAPRTPL
jgi:non-heme chloroperoxidase